MTDDVERVETTNISEAMRGERSFIEVPRATEVVTRPLDTQDYLDGLALRRLREALPAHTIQVKFDVLAYGRQCVVAAADGDDAYMALADTIAEAADACREALKGS